MINNPYQSYNNAQVMTATPGELTLMLYNGCIRFLKQAKAAMEQKQVQETNTNITRAQNIITELMSTLRMEYEISKNLMELYQFMQRHLLMASLKKESQKVQDIIELMEDLRNTWQEAVKLARIQAAASN